MNQNHPLPFRIRETQARNARHQQESGPSQARQSIVDPPFGWTNPEAQALRPFQDFAPISSSSATTTETAPLSRSAKKRRAKKRRQGQQEHDSQLDTQPSQAYASGNRRPIVATGALPIITPATRESYLSEGLNSQELIEERIPFQPGNYDPGPRVVGGAADRALHMSSDYSPNSPQALLDIHYFEDFQPQISLSNEFNKALNAEWEAALPHPSRPNPTSSAWVNPPTWDPDQDSWDPSTTRKSYSDRGRAVRKWDSHSPARPRNQRKTWANIVAPPPVKSRPPDPETSDSDIDETWLVEPHFLQRVRSSFRNSNRQRSPSVHSEWEHYPTSLLGQVAEEASVLLELFHKTKPEDDDDIGTEHSLMIDNALRGVLKIHKQLRMKAAREGIVEERIEDVEGTNVDAGCIICYTEIADTVLFPCRHLALCGGCCDGIGIKGKELPGVRTAKCPVCRTIVLDKVKVFRS